MREAERQLSDASIYEEIKINEKDLVDLFAKIERKSIIQKNEKTYFKFDFKKAMSESFTYYPRFIKV